MYRSISVTTSDSGWPVVSRMETELERWLSADADEGNDAWKPQVLLVFGLDTASGRPNQVVCLVSLPVWGPRWMSTDTSEGDPSVDLTVTPG